MSSFGASRFTAMLATIAILGTASSLWWALETRANLKSGANSRAAEHASPSKSARAARAKDDGVNKFTPYARNERSQPASVGWGDERGQPSERPVASPVLMNYVGPVVQRGVADMPLPIPTRSDPQAWPAKSLEPPVPVFAPPPVESPKRQVRDSQVRDSKPDSKPEPAAVAAPSAPKPTTRSYYMEKFVEQGDAGEVKYRYRRQPCEPPNMPDVCFMPQANRRNIVVERQ